MGMMDRLIQAVTGQRSVYPPMLPGQDNFINSVLMGGVNYNLNTTLTNDTEPIGAGFQSFVQGAYKGNGIVYACSAARLMLLSQARFQWQRMEKGQPGDLFGNKDLEILEHPEPGKVTADMLGHASVDTDYAGNAFVARRVIERSVQRLQYKRMRPDWVDIIVGSHDGGGRDSLDAEVLGYTYWPGGRYSGHDPEILLPEEVAHIAPIPDPLHRFRGMSWLTPIIRDVQGDSAATAHKDIFFRNGATVNLIVQTGLSSTDLDRFEKWRKLFNESHQGIGNAYKTLFLTQGADATPVGSNFLEMDFAKTQTHDETRIAVAAGVHPVILGISEGLGGSSLNQGNFMAARRLVADMTLRPWWGTFSASMEVISPPPPGCRLWYDERHIPFLAEDVKDAADVQSTNAQAIKALLDAGWDADFVVDAVTSGDLSRLKGHHSGLFSVQLQPPQPEGPPDPAPELVPVEASPNGKPTPQG
jgi:hypothetical protein